MSVPTEEFQVRQDVVPFVMIPHWVLESGVSGNAIALYVALGTFTTGQGGNCYPTRDTLAAKMGVSVNTMRRAMSELEAAGAIRVERRKSAAGDNTSNLYHLAFNEPYVSAGHDGVGSPVSRPRPTGEPTGGPTGEPQTRTTLTKNHSTTPAAPRSEPVAAQVTPDAAAPEAKDGELFHVKEPAHIPTAGDIVNAWCEGWSEARDGKRVDNSVVRRVAGSCKQVAKTRTDLESWRVAWQAAKDAGRQGRYDVVAHLADFQPPARKTRDEHFNERLRASAARVAARMGQDTIPALAGPQTARTEIL